MQKQPETESNSSNFPWLNLAETISVAASIGGSIATIFLKEAFFIASVPLSVSVALNLVNRRQILNRLNLENQMAIAQLSNQWQASTEAQQSTLSEVKENQARIETHSKQLAEVKQLLTGLSQRTQELYFSTQNQDRQQQQIKEVIGYLREVENLSQTIQANPNSSDGYYKRGLVYQRLEDRQSAIEDYNKAIQLDPNCAAAFHYRGVLSSELEDKKGALEDLRQAAKLYFRQGNVEAYKEARDLSEQLHNLNSQPQETAESVETDDDGLVLSNFFS